MTLEEQNKLDKMIEEMKEFIGDTSDLDSKKEKFLNENKSTVGFYESLSDEEQQRLDAINSLESLERCRKADKVHFI